MPVLVGSSKKVVKALASKVSILVRACQCQSCGRVRLVRPEMQLSEALATLRQLSESLMYRAELGAGQ